MENRITSRWKGHGGDSQPSGSTAMLPPPFFAPPQASPDERASAWSSPRGGAMDLLDTGVEMQPKKERYSLPLQPVTS